jgi:hypothetical protein
VRPLAGQSIGQLFAEISRLSVSSLRIERERAQDRGLRGFGQIGAKFYR